MLCGLNSHPADCDLSCPADTLIIGVPKSEKDGDSVRPDGVADTDTDPPRRRGDRVERDFAAAQESPPGTSRQYGNCPLSAASDGSADTANYDDTIWSRPRNSEMISADGPALVTRNRWPSSTVTSRASGMSFARMRPLTTGTMGSSVPAMTSVGCDRSRNQGRLVQPKPATSCR